MFISRYYKTLRYLRPVQVFGRIWFRLYSPSIGQNLASPALRNLDLQWMMPACRLSSLVAPECFFLVNEQRRLEEIGWNGTQCSKLFRYNQHYFDDLNAYDATTRSEWHNALLRRWVLENLPSRGDGWEPYPTSLRIVNWVKWSFSGNRLSEDCVDSLAVQARWLCKRLEYHLLGNHLFANAKALIFVGTFFCGREAAKWLAKGLRILNTEIPEQILKDGGQFERSTMYHALALEDMLDLLNVLRLLVKSPDEYSSQLTSVIENSLGEIESRIPSMMAWLYAMCHPDGEIALFNDAAFDVAPSCRELFAYAERLGFGTLEPLADVVTTLKESGYIRMEKSVACVFFDAAPIGPDYLPGHAHADSLSIELSLFGKRVFVNSGTSEYGTTKERHRQRSTAAHNTVEINEENSSEVWSGFRVARRAFPYKVNSDQKSDCLVATAWQDGYMRLSSPVYVGRRVTLGAHYLKIEDLVQGQFRSAVSRFYCHPDIEPVLLSPGVVHLKLQGGNSAWLKAPEGATLSIHTATWHPRFGVTVPNKCIEITLAAIESITMLEWSQM
jgi:uncharacterized heparinase superfamily protein